MKSAAMGIDVLLVEDSPGDIRLTQEAFRAANSDIRLHVAMDGVEALAFLSAWIHRLEPGMRAIAVSRDLARLGLVHGRKVRIDGLRGEWVVRDRMPERWKRRIDVYMGEDLDAALAFGRRRVRIHWQE